MQRKKSEKQENNANIESEISNNSSESSAKFELTDKEKRDLYLTIQEKIKEKLANKRKERNNNTNTNFSRFSWYSIIATWFFSGLFSFAPGTWGSLAAYPVYFFMSNGSSSQSEAIYSLWFAIGLILLIGIPAVERYHKMSGKIDDKSIVIDEVVGQLLTIALAYPDLMLLSVRFYKVTSEISILNYAFLISLILFRIFDIFKPLGIAIFDRMKNTWGVFLDDIVAAVYASLLLRLFSKLSVFLL